MGKQQSKPEEIIIAQNAAAGSNDATVDILKAHIGTTNIVLGIIALIVLLFFMYFVYRIYKRCHKKWITSELNQHALRRSLSFYRANRRGGNPQPESA